MNEEKYIKSPSTDPSVKVIKMFLENIGQQYFTKIGKAIYSDEDIRKALEENDERYTLILNFGNIQLELIDLFRRADRLTQSIFFTRVTLESLYKNETISKELKALNFSETNETYDSINSEGWKSTNLEKIGVYYLVRNIINDIKELTIISNVIYHLGIVWGIKTIKASGKELGEELLENFNAITRISDLNITYKLPILEKKYQDEIKNELRRIDGQAPILTGYFLGFSDYEEFVRLWHDEK